MKIATLVDNNTQDKQFNTEHGLSLYIETDSNRKILYDTGQSDLFLQNAKKMNINLEGIDAVIISHGHYDHIGGLLHFMEVNKNAQIYMHSTLFDYQYFSIKNGVKKVNGYEEKLRNYRDRFTFVSENVSFNDFHLIARVAQKFALPKGNRVLFRKNSDGWELDKFEHELVAVLETEQGLCVLTGCAHNGVLNIVDTLKEALPNKKIVCLFGGLHLIDSKEYVETETKKELESLATKLKLAIPDVQIYTGHCTGTKASSILSSFFINNFNPLYVGQIVQF